MMGKISALLVSVSVALANGARADVEVSNKPTSNMSCDAGVCTATAQEAVLNVSDLAGMLASGDVEVKTGSLAKDIDIDHPLTWSSTVRLTLDAQASVTVKKQITIAGQGALTIITNDAGGAKAKNKTGEFIIVPEHGSVQFWDLGSSLIIDGNSYTLVDDIKTLASDIADNPSGSYALAKSYDASGDGTYFAAPIATKFNGKFEGLGGAISNLAINTNNSGPAGLFEYIDSNGEVKDIGLVGATVVGRGQINLGLLAGDNVGLVERCRATGKLKFLAAGVGGLVGANLGVIAASTADARLSGASDFAGGLVGYNDGGTIELSSTFGSVALRSSTLAYAGGLVGDNHGDIQNSFARNRVKNGRKNNNSYFGGVTGENDPGGQIQNSYAAGEISPYSGGLVGFDAAAAGNISESYWDLDMGVSDPSRGAGNIKNDPGITGLTDAQFKSGLPKGFDPKIWGSDPKINNGYPYLLANPPAR